MYVFAESVPGQAEAIFKGLLLSQHFLPWLHHGNVDLTRQSSSGRRDSFPCKESRGILAHNSLSSCMFTSSSSSVQSSPFSFSPLFTSVVALDRSRAAHEPRAFLATVPVAPRLNRGEHTPCCKRDIAPVETVVCLAIGEPLWPGPIRVPAGLVF